MDSRNALIQMLNRTLTRSKETSSRVQTRVAAKLCLNQFEVTENGETRIVDCDNSTVGGRRGLCQSCAREFYDSLKFGTISEADLHERKMIQKGLVLGRDELRERHPNRKSLIRRRRA